MFKTRLGIYLQQHRFTERAALVMSDTAVLVAAFFIGHMLNWLPDGAFYSSYAEWWTSTGRNILVLYGCLAVLSQCRMAGYGHYTRRKPFWDEMREVWQAILLCAAFDAAIMFLTKSQFSRLGFAVSWVIAIPLIGLARIAARQLLIRAGRWMRPTVVIGSGEGVLDAVTALQSEPMMGFDVVAIIAPEADVANLGDCLPATCRLLPLTENLITTLEELQAAQIVLTFEANEWLRQKHLVSRLYRYYPDVHLIPPCYGLPLCGAEISHFFRHEVLLITVRNNLARLWPRIIKRTTDIVLSFALLLLLSPLFFALTVLIRRDGGSAYYSHQRIGRNGKCFGCVKFRTMVPNGDKLLAKLLAADPVARDEWERDRKLKNDPRITRIGNFLRRTSLDELPQLWNVLKGEMSLVGPRPITAPELDYYGDQADYYLETRPGITGLWQISGRNNVSYAHRVYLDAWYAKNWSFWYDLVILLKTVNVVLGRSGAY